MTKAGRDYKMNSKKLRKQLVIMNLDEKYEKLKSCLKALGSVAVAFSGGVDSAFLLKAAKDALGDKALAVTACSCLIPEHEMEESVDFCAAEGIRHIVCNVNPVEIDGFADNPPNRCYICKKGIFSIIKQAAAENGASAVVEGSNLDDNGDYRPGLKAIRELGVLSPLQAVGFTKQEIRDMSAKLGLPTWSKPSFACLASRFAYGECITEAGLHRIDKAERVLAGLGFSQFRVRVHGSIARIEVPQEDMQMLLDNREQIYPTLHALGFAYVTMDLKGYRTGSMNEVL